MLKRALAASLRTGVGNGITVNLLVVVATLPFLLVPPTASVRAGGWGLLMVGGAAYGLAVGLPQSWRQVRHGQLGMGLLGCVLALTPLPLSYWLFHLCAHVKGFVVAP